MKPLACRRWALLIGLMTLQGVADEQRQWPGVEWRTATPASQQVDDVKLDALHREFAAGEHGNIDGISVYRNGYLVYRQTYKNDYVRMFARQEEKPGQYNYHDANWHPWYDHGELHTIQSISKSVTSALIGIALRRGELPGVDIKIMPYFADYEFDDDSRWAEITLHDLLTMTAGIDWDETTTAYTDPANSAAALEASDEWVQFVLDQGIRAAPGEEFEYNSGITVLLSHILLQATGRHADEYAVEHLFAPLAIEKFFWKKTPTGLVDTEGGLYLRPEDLAKIGYLYLHDGIWDGKRILPEGWVAASIAPAVEVPDYYARYGYQWWLVPYQGATAGWALTGLGYGGQRVYVVPEYALVVVYTGWNIDDNPPLDARMGLQRVIDAMR